LHACLVMALRPPDLEAAFVLSGPGSQSVAPLRFSGVERVIGPANAAG